MSGLVDEHAEVVLSSILRERASWRGDEPFSGADVWILLSCLDLDVRSIKMVFEAALIAASSSELEPVVGVRRSLYALLQVVEKLLRQVFNQVTIPDDRDKAEVLRDVIIEIPDDEKMMIARRMRNLDNSLREYTKVIEVEAKTLAVLIFVLVFLIGLVWLALSGF